MTKAQIAYFNRFLKENGIYHAFYSYMSKPGMLTTMARHLIGLDFKTQPRVMNYLLHLKYWSGAIIDSFVFSRTSEGSGFWHQMSQKYCELYDTEYESFSRKFYKRHDSKTNKKV